MVVGLPAEVVPIFRETRMEMKLMLNGLQNSISIKITLMLLVSILMVACTSNKYDENDQPVEPSFQEKVTQCSKIADRSERDRCLYDN